MKIALTMLSLVALLMVILPACLAFGSGTGLNQAMKNVMLVGTCLWFAAATPLTRLFQTVGPEKSKCTKPR